jgi:cold shock CspA family protein
MDREEGTIVFFDHARGFGFCAADGTDPTDKSRNLYVSVHALRRAGLLSLNKGDRISFRREKRQGRKDEVQDIRVISPAARRAA